MGQSSSQPLTEYPRVSSVGVEIGPLLQTPKLVCSIPIPRSQHPDCILDKRGRFIYVDSEPAVRPDWKSEQIYRYDPRLGTSELLQFTAEKQYPGNLSLDGYYPSTDTLILKYYTSGSEGDKYTVYYHFWENMTEGPQHLIRGHGDYAHQLPVGTVKLGETILQKTHTGKGYCFQHLDKVIQEGTFFTLPDQEEYRNLLYYGGYIAITVNWPYEIDHRIEIYQVLP